MAITDALKGVEVKIKVNGVDLPEYEKKIRGLGEDVQVIGSTTRYIEIASGQNFEVAAKVLPGYSFSAAKTLVWTSIFTWMVSILTT